LYRAASTAALVAVAVAGFVTVLEWRENPGGIFRDSSGTAWSFVGDTFWSWWWPTFLHIAIILGIVVLIRTVLRRRRS